MRLSIRIRRTNWRRFFASLEIILGGILLIYELRDFNRLPTTYEVDRMYGGLVDLAKYKESTYPWIFFYFIVFLAGLFYFKNTRISWILTQAWGLVIILTAFFGAGMIFISEGTFYSLILFPIVLALAVAIELIIWKIKPSPDKTPKKTFILGILSGLICFSVFGYLKIMR